MASFIPGRRNTSIEGEDCQQTTPGFPTEYLIQTGTDQHFKIQSEYIIKQTLLSALTHKEVTRTSP